MNTFSLRGLGIALVTPFKQDYSIDFQALSRIVERDVAAGVDYIVVLGTTGESVTLSPHERLEVIQAVKEKVNGHIPLVLGVGGNCTASVLNDLKMLPLDGFSAILSVTPYYNKPSQEGLFRHYSAIADASPLPVILYNVPGRTGVNMLAPTSLRLASHPNIIGVKEASGNLNQAEDIIKGAPEGFSVVSGDDALAFPFICMGATGVISVIGNAYPAEFSKLVHASLDADMDMARHYQQRFDSMFRFLFRDGNPAGIKCLMNRMGLIENLLRLPLTPCSEDTDKLISEAMEALAKEVD